MASLMKYPTPGCPHNKYCVLAKCPTRPQFPRKVPDMTAEDHRTLLVWTLDHFNGNWDGVRAAVDATIFLLNRWPFDTEEARALHIAAVERYWRHP